MCDLSATVVYETRLDLTDLSLGVVVNRNAFVCHTPTDCMQELDAIRVLFQNDSKRVKLQFKTFEQTVSSFGQSSDANNICYNYRRYEFHMSFANIKSINLFGDRVYLNLRHPALLYRIINEREIDYNRFEPSDEDWDERNTEKDEDFDSAFESDSSFDDDFDNFDVSSSSFIDNNNFCGLRVRVNTFCKLNAHMFTKTNSICLRFASKNENDVKIEQILKNISLFTNNNEINIEILREEYLLSFADIECAITYDMFTDLPFNIKYLLQAINEYSYKFIDSLSVNECTVNDFRELLDEFCNENIEAVEQSLSEIYDMVQNGLPLNPLNDLRQSFEKYNKSRIKKWANETIKYVRRCILTPTRLLLLPALPQQQSRFLRTCDPEYAIRLLIKDEDLQLLSFTACLSSIPDDRAVTHKIAKYLQKTITNRVEDGLLIGGRTYEFVGASTSQLRDHGLILYARDQQNRDAKQICKQIGKLSEIRNTAKFISKIGLSMSQSMGYITLTDANNVFKIEDIEGGVHPHTQKPYTFSDGVGMVSSSLALKLAKGVNRSEPIPSTYQIRYAGCKGVVVINPELEGDVIKIRPSMIKFESESLDIDVLKMSEARSVYLNRPLIAILEAMGVSHQAFQQLLFDRLEEICTAFRCNCNAIKLIKSYTNLKLPYKHLINSGINLLNEPFFVNIVESIVKKVSRDLKNKARILVPLNESRIMFGVIDETKSLKYGEVFVQYTDVDDGSKKVLEGEILVTKYPCMHGGDVRKFTAIKVRALMHIVDCIVFPADGDRPHADEMAGSDLDGDEYSVIWCKSLIFKRPNHAPMDFPCGEAIDLDRAVTTEDVLNFYCTFIQKNQVGLIASSHLAWADFQDEGIFCKKCRILDYKYATALDFAKTGKNERLKNCDRPPLYPNFMMKNHEKPTYTSMNALGKLYEMNCYFNDAIEDICEQTAADYSPNAKLIHKNAVIYFDEALNAFERYKSAIKQLKAQFGVESECALLSGSFIKAHKYVYTQNDSDSRDLMSAIVDKLFMDFLIIFEGNEKDEQILLAKASAWYQVSHTYNANALKEDKYFGFPWIISRYLLKLIDSSDQKINSCCNHNSSQSILEINSRLDTREIIHCILRALILYSENEHLFLLHVPNIKKYVEQVIDCCAQSININNVFETIMKVLQKLSECSVDWSYEETKLKIGLVAIITKYRLLRCDNNITRLINLAKTQQSDKHIASSLVISEKLAKFIKERENEFISHIQNKIVGIKHILVRYRQKKNSVLTVVGTKSAVKLFTYVLYDRHLCHNLEDNVFFKQNISCKARY